MLGNDHDLRRQDTPLLADCVDECDVVHFLAFAVGGSTYLERCQDTFGFISNNAKIMDRVFDVLARTRKPFLFASSQMSNLGHSTYGRLKSVGESYTRALGGVVLQFWNVFGWEPDPEKSHVITDFIRMARDHGRIAMRTDGSEERQFLYGDDCADCLIELSARYASIDRDRALHVASFEWTSIRRIARIVSARFGNCPISAGSRADTVQRSTRIEPDPYVLQFWRPATPLQEGIDRVARRMLGDLETPPLSRRYGPTHVPR